MANRRQGGGYGGGGRPFNNYAMAGPVNPWQVGNMPGGQGGGPFNPGGQSHLLSQLSDPQAQLALALTQLLKPQQSVPSLLTMDTINPHQPNSGGGAGGGHYHHNNYPHRGRDNMNMNNRRSRTDFKRHEPYNKMNSRNDNKRGRNDSSNRRGNSIKNERKVQAHRTTVVSKLTNKAKVSSKSSERSEKKATTSTTTKPVVKEEPKSTAEVDNTDSAVVEVDVKREDNVEETEETDEKRDWKDEKSNEEPNETETHEDAVEIEDAPKVEDETKVEDKEKTAPKARRNKYANIPKSLLECHVCVKSMWDGDSYEKHMSGKAHRQMLDKIEESYRVKADMMREAIRLSEAKKSIEIDRMKRLGKSPKNLQKARCAMCDLEFHGQLFVHRKSSSHQKLKYFLHPRCVYCNKEFATRMEWETHRHSIEHLRQKARNPEKDKKTEKNQAEEDEILIDDECFVVLDSIENEEEEEGENALIDLTDDLADDVPIVLPTYKSNRSVGLSLITPVTGHYCKSCSRFFLTEEASQQHAQSRKHFDAFVGVLNEKITEKEERKRKQTEDDEGNWKRRKISKDDDEELEKIEDDNEADEINEVISVKDDDEQDVTKEDIDTTQEEQDEMVDEDQDVKIEENLDEKQDDLDGAKDQAVTEDGNDLYDPAETFTATDPNDVTLGTADVSSADDTSEIYNSIDDILDENKEQLKKEVVTTPKKDIIPKKEFVIPKKDNAVKQVVPAKQVVPTKQVVPVPPKPPIIKGKQPVARRGRVRK